MSVSASAVQPDKRLYYLDWLRVFIIGGVFLAHTVLPFTGGNWLIVSGAIIPITAFIALVGNQFGMPLLFLISGAAVVFAMRRRTQSAVHPRTLHALDRAVYRSGFLAVADSGVLRSARSRLVQRIVHRLLAELLQS